MNGRIEELEALELADGLNPIAGTTFATEALP